MVESVTEGLNERNLTTGIFLGFIKAFDCLDHELLIPNLENLGVANKAKKWFKSYLRGRSQLVVLR